MLFSRFLQQLASTNLLFDQSPPLPPISQVTAPWAALFSLMGIAARVPGVLLRVEPARVLPALLIVVLVNLLAFVVQLAADLRTRRLFIRAEQQQRNQGSTTGGAGNSTD